MVAGQRNIAAMASRLMSFLSKRVTPLLASCTALIFCVMLFREWRSHVSEQAELMAVYPELLARGATTAELEHLLPSADFLALLGLATGVTIAAAVVQWRQSFLTK